MIESARFVNVRGDTVIFNDTELPFNEFTTEVDTRNNEKQRSQDHGLYPSNTYLGKRLFHCNGDLLENTSGDYWNKRRELIRAVLPRPHLGFTQAGTLYLTLTGMNEELSCDCTIDGWPELPLAALSPSAGKYQINFKAFDPRLYGAWQQTVLPYMSQNLGGRTYNKTYNKTYVTPPGVSSDQIITNSGDIESPPILRIYGPAPNPKIALFRDDGVTQYVQLNGLTLTGASDYAVIDVRRRTAVRNTGQNLYDFAVGSDWWALEPDPWVNVVRLLSDTPSGGTPYATIDWRNAYMI